MRVLDAGRGNGLYLRALATRPVRAAGCDLSAGMLRAAGHPALMNADLTALPVRDGAFDVVLATWPPSSAVRVLCDGVFRPMAGAPAGSGRAWRRYRCQS